MLYAKLKDLLQIYLKPYAGAINKSHKVAVLSFWVRHTKLQDNYACSALCIALDISNEKNIWKILFLLYKISSLKC